MLIVNALIEKQHLENQHTPSLEMCAQFVCLYEYVRFKAREIVRKSKVLQYSLHFLGQILYFSLLLANYIYVWTATYIRN